MFITDQALKTGMEPLPRRGCFLRVLARLLVVIGMTILLAWSGFAEGKEENPAVVGIVYGNQASYQTAACSLQKTLESLKYQCVMVALPKADSKTETGPVPAEIIKGRPKVLVGVGIQAVILLRQSDLKVPLVFSMIPNILDAPFWNEKSRLPVVTTDIDPKAQVGWIKKICPEVKNIGMLYSPRTQKTSEAVRKAGKGAGVEITAVMTAREKFTDGLTELHQKECDAVLMLPDTGVYDSTKVRALLIWGIRKKIPVFGFSESVVKAGAFAGQYSKNEEIGKLTGEMVVDLLKGKTPDKIGLHYSNPVQRAVNLRTAELIGITINEAVLKDVTKRFGKDE